MSTLGIVVILLGLTLIVTTYTGSTSRVFSTILS